MWAGVNFSKPLIRTGTSFPEISICGGLPGLKIRSLTLSDARNISRSTVMKFGGGAWVEVVGVVGSLLIFYGNFFQCWCVKLLLINLLKVLPVILRINATVERILH